MIRVQTRISRVLGELLREFEEDYIRVREAPIKKKAA